jgi:surface antigen
MFRRALFATLMLCTILTACDKSERDQSVRLSNITPPVKVRPSPVTGPGALLGSWLGSDILITMNDADRVKNRQAETRAFTSTIGQQVTWANEDSGNSGTIVPTKDDYNAKGDYCRQFQQSVTLSERKLQGRVTACQQADGSWKAE